MANTPDKVQVKTVEQCKNEVARSKGNYGDWVTYYDWIARDNQLPSVIAQLIESATEEAMNIYHAQFQSKEPVREKGNDNEFLTMQFPGKEGSQIHRDTEEEELEFLLQKSKKEIVLENKDVWEWIAIFYGSLINLVNLKNHKDTIGKDANYLEQQPQAWHAAQQAVELWKQSDYGAKPFPQPPTPLSKGQDGEDALFYLSELVRTVSRVCNKFPDAFHDHDLDRLTQAKQILRKYSNTDKSQILTQSTPPDVSECYTWVKQQIQICESEILSSSFLIMHDRSSVKEYWKGKLDSFKNMLEWISPMVKETK